jgi:hypothetical protein
MDVGVSYVWSASSLPVFPDAARHPLLQHVGRMRVGVGRNRREVSTV